MFNIHQKIGILGGGQLGKMLCLAAGNWDLSTYILDHADCPAARFATGFQAGDFKNYNDVLDFGRKMDILTIEIEHVNTDALHQLVSEGKTVHPHPAVLDVIKDKGLQKQFYQQHGIPTASFRLFDDEKQLRRAIQKGELTLPFVQKTRKAGYDGRGVAIIRTAADVENKLLPGACLAETWVAVQAELAVVAAKNAEGEVRIFPPVEMEFHPEANLVEFLCCPARISGGVAAQAEALAERVIRQFDVCGLLAVEMFLTQNHEILVNEVAPRPHNSGHHTIDAAVTSQFQQHLLGICNLPLGDTAATIPAVMINLLGAEGHAGPVRYEGIEKCLTLGGVKIHLYGKKNTQPFRKMGHVTVVDNHLDKAIEKARLVKKWLRVVAA